MLFVQVFGCLFQKTCSSSAFETLNENASFCQSMSPRLLPVFSPPETFLQNQRESIGSFSAKQRKSQFTTVVHDTMSPLH